MTTATERAITAREKKSRTAWAKRMEREETEADEAAEARADAEEEADAAEAETGKAKK